MLVLLDWVLSSSRTLQNLENLNNLGNNTINIIMPRILNKVPPHQESTQTQIEGGEEQGHYRRLLPSRSDKQVRSASYPVHRAQLLYLATNFGGSCVSFPISILMIKLRQSELPFQLNVNIIRGKKQTNLASTSANSSASLFKTIEINSNENKLWSWIRVKRKANKERRSKPYPLSLNPSHNDQNPNPKNSIVVMWWVQVREI